MKKITQINLTRYILTLLSAIITPTHSFQLVQNFIRLSTSQKVKLGSFKNAL